jgi:hypothetical protein
MLVVLTWLMVVGREMRAEISIKAQIKKVEQRCLFLQMLRRSP